MKEIKQLIAIQKSLQNKFKKFNKKFTISGNIIGDLGEVLAAEKYKLFLFRDNQKNYDATERTNGKGRKIQIKASLIGKCYITVDPIPEVFLSLNINEDGQLEEIFNGPGKFIEDNYQNFNELKRSRNKYVTLSAKKLKELNKLVVSADKIKLK